MTASPLSRLVTIALALFALGATPLPPAPPLDANHPWCATGPATDDRVETIERWVLAQEERLAKSGAPVAAAASMRIESDIILLEASPSMIPLRNPVDLVGRSVEYVPQGDGSFRVTTMPLAYDEDVGASFHQFAIGASGWHFRARDLSAFAFPFGDAPRTRLFITAHNAIHFETPPLLTAYQLSSIEALSLDGAFLSPLLHTHRGTIFPLPEVFVKETGDAVTVTWRAGPSEWGFALDLQARLEASGRVLFSYRMLDGFDWGAALVTTGSEAWRANRETLWSTGTPSPPFTGTQRDMLDIKSASVGRIGGSDVIEITLTAASRIRQNILPTNRYLGYYVELRNPSSGRSAWIYLYVTRDNVQYRTPDRGWVAQSPAGGFDESTVRMRVSQHALGLDDSAVDVRIWTYNAASEPSISFLSGTLTLAPPGSTAGADLSALSNATVQGPVVEAFTLGVLNTAAVWSALKAAHGFTDEHMDAVAIYQDFFTDIILYAGAYSTVGNPGVDGVTNRTRYGTAHPRAPALLHMNRVGYRWNADLPRSYHVLSHELGHRWLYFINIDQGGGPNNVLQPLGGHPAQYVHTPAAFQVHTDRDSSTMGGSNFLDHGGSFSTPDDFGYYGYSWHDLYLMGLAGPEEVENWYWIENSSPALAGAYYPPPRLTVTGTRRNVSIDDVIRGMGPRRPVAAASQKRFKVVFVLLSLPGTSASAETFEMLAEQRKWFERTFRVATGHRGKVDSTLVPVRRHGVRPR